MSYLTYELERSYAVSFDELNKQIVDLEYRKTHWPVQFDLDQQAELANCYRGRDILGSWLEDVVDSQVTVRKKRGAIRQLTVLIELLKENPLMPVTANQGLCIDHFIYPHIARIISSSFYSFDFSCSRPTLQRSATSSFDANNLCQYLHNQVESLVNGKYSNYVQLEKAMAACIDSVIKMRALSCAA